MTDSDAERDTGYVHIPRQEVDDLKTACAEMRTALQDASNWLDMIIRLPTPFCVDEHTKRELIASGAKFHAAIVAASDAGKGWMSPAVADCLRAELDQARAEAANLREAFERQQRGECACELLHYGCVVCTAKNLRAEAARTQEWLEKFQGAAAAGVLALQALKACADHAGKIDEADLARYADPVLDGTAAKALLDELATLRAARDAAQRVREVLSDYIQLLLRNTDWEPGSETTLDSTESNSCAAKGKE